MEGVPFIHGYGEKRCTFYSWITLPVNRDLWITLPGPAAVILDENPTIEFWKYGWGWDAGPDGRAPGRPGHPGKP